MTPDPSGSHRRHCCVMSSICPTEVEKARLYVTSLGVHQVSINGLPVTDELLNPGWSSYHHRLLAATYDVTALLSSGRNVVSGALGDGWYRGRLGWDPTGGDRARYGSDLGLIAQLEIELSDGSSMRVVTNQEWLASTGEIRSADLYDGSVIDFGARQPGWEHAGFDSAGWVPAAVIPFDRSLIRPRTAPRSRRWRHFRSPSSVSRQARPFSTEGRTWLGSSDSG